MLLKSIDYSEYIGRAQEWALEGLTLGPRNLLVGKNATGKSRTLNVIAGLAQLLCGERTPSGLNAGSYKATFSEGDKLYEYQLNIENKQVLAESFSVDGKLLLNRGAMGEGDIWAEKISNGVMMEFQTPQGELAAFVRRDLKQHSFLEPLYQWGSTVRHYQFGTSLGKDNLAVFLKKGGGVPDGKKPEEVVGLFERAKRDFPQKFVEGVRQNMERIDYPLTEINVGPPITVQFNTILARGLVGLRVREKGLKGITDQLGMSQGMFRVLSLLIQTNYLKCLRRPGCVIIDDIGEGLDFDRSCLLIDLLREEAENNRLQLIAATNDKFVMNKVPLDEWSVLQRGGSRVKVLNKANSPKLFEEFRFTGLSNFSFLEFDFPNAQAEEMVVHE